MKVILKGEERLVRGESAEWEGNHLLEGSTGGVAADPFGVQSRFTFLSATLLSSLYIGTWFLFH